MFCVRCCAGTGCRVWSARRRRCGTCRWAIGARGACVSARPILSDRNLPRPCLAVHPGMPHPCLSLPCMPPAPLPWLNPHRPSTLPPFHPSTPLPRPQEDDEALRGAVDRLRADLLGMQAAVKEAQARPGRKASAPWLQQPQMVARVGHTDSRTRGRMGSVQGGSHVCAKHPPRQLLSPDRLWPGTCLSLTGEPPAPPHLSRRSPTRARRWAMRSGRRGRRRTR
jgi:hypothetical protein